MPPPSRKHLPHTALYWEIATGADRTDAYGEIQVRQPVELRVRWETMRTESVSFAAQGATVAFEATVYLEREVTVGSLLWLGSFGDWLGTGTGTGGTEDALGGELHQVQGYDEIADVKGRVHERMAKCIRYKDQMPAVI
jgi:hypothetical protein